MMIPTNNCRLRLKQIQLALNFLMQLWQMWSSFHWTILEVTDLKISLTSCLIRVQGQCYIKKLSSQSSSDKMTSLKFPTNKIKKVGKRRRSKIHWWPYVGHPCIINRKKFLKVFTLNFFHFCSSSKTVGK